MASVTLTTLWISVADDLSLSYAMPLSAITWNTSKVGSVRTYGNGRRRIVKRAGIVRTADIALGFCDRATINRLESWAGTLLCFRDPMGRKVYGVFWTVPVVEIDGDDGATISLSVEEVTHSEEV